MYPTINNKSLLECNKDDLQILLNNPDYREGQYLEYKKAFAFQEADKERKAEELTEFRNDICSFANAEGGYILYGVVEREGIASEIIGVTIQNRDTFELELRNRLSVIQPKIPSVNFGFVSLENKRYVVIVEISHDSYSPYTQLVDEKNYRFYKREGNEKKPIRYNELKNMFIQSRTLETEIL